MIDTYSLSALKAGSGILDIAGGKGELAFEFVNLNDCPCTVVDPRPLVLARYIKRMEMGIYWRNEIMNKYNTAKPHVSEVPQHLRVMFEIPRDEVPGGENDGRSDVLPLCMRSRAAWDEARELAMVHQTSKHSTSEIANHTHEKTCNGVPNPHTLSLRNPEPLHGSTHIAKPAIVLSHPRECSPRYRPHCHIHQTQEQKCHVFYHFQSRDPAPGASPLLLFPCVGDAG